MLAAGLNLSISDIFYHFFDNIQTNFTFFKFGPITPISFVISVNSMYLNFLKKNRNKNSHTYYK